MPDYLTDFSDAMLIQAIEANIEGFFQSFCRLPAAEVIDTPEMLRVCTGVPDFIVNGVIRSCLPEADLDTQIAETVEYFQSRRLPMLWLTGPSTQPANLGAHLQAHGLQFAGSVPGMAADLQNLSPVTSLPPGVTIEEVTDDARLEDWINVPTKMGQLPEASRILADASAALGFGKESPFRNFVAYRDGEPVGISQVYLDGRVAGIYSVCVISEARRQGIGAALTAAALQTAQERGYRISVLLASGMGTPIYLRLGFEDHGQFAFYVRDVEREK